MGWRDDGIVVVTGGSSGLGAAVVSAVLKSGGRVAVLDRQAPSDGVEHVLVDLADGRAAEAAVAELARREPAFAAIVCAAGIDACGRLADVDAADWERVIQVNLLGTAAVLRAGLRHLVHGGRIVTVASTLGLRAVSDASAYCASKFAVVGFTRALAAELAGEFGVTLLVPGGMQTAFFDGRPAQYQPPRDALLNRPEHVADAVLFTLDQPAGCEVRELVVCPSTETSWP